MLTNIRVKHYKAFDEAEVAIKPLTVLLGANSVGKSSIIQLLLALKQTSMVDSDNYASCLKIYGSDVNLGSAENMFRRFDVTIPMILSFSFRNELLFNNLGRLLDDYLADINRAAMFFQSSELRQLSKKPHHSKKDYLSFVKEIQIAFNNEKEGFNKERFTFYPFGIYDLNISYDKVFQAPKQQLEKIYDLLNGIKKLSQHEFDIEFQLRYVDKSTLYLDGLNLSINKQVLIAYKTNKNKTSISSDFISFNAKEKAIIKESFNENNVLFSCFKKEVSSVVNNSNYDLVTGYIIHITNRVLTSLRNSFGNSMINHVSPLRAHPKRYYMLDKANVTFSLDTLDGDAIAEVLKENGTIKKKVNKWLEKFKLSVDVEEFKEIIHHLKVKQNDLSLDITDVGFGISQVLPIIIQGFLSRNDSLTIVEQPEIHLHPKMQADLADLFIDMVNNKKTNREIIVETHSEYLLKRLRRRISEGVISANDVSICLFYPQTKDNGAIIKNLNIAEKGSFEWPQDFYDGELSKDITEFLKNQ